MQRVVLCLSEGTTRVDPAREETATRDAELGTEWDGTSAGVGFAVGGWSAVDPVGGRIEMVPGADRDILERVWPRVLSHLAPGTKRT